MFKIKTVEKSDWLAFGVLIKELDNPLLVNSVPIPIKTAIEPIKPKLSGPINLAINNIVIKLILLSAKVLVKVHTRLEPNFFINFAYLLFF